MRVCATLLLALSFSISLLQVYTQMMVPFCPHWSEHVWRNVLHCKGSVWHAGWPKAEQPDLILQVNMMLGSVPCPVLVQSEEGIARGLRKALC